MKKPNTLRPVLALALVLVLALTAAGAALADERDALRAEQKLAEARAALNAERYKEAARLYGEVYSVAEARELAGDALYWEAFARYRLQQTAELKQALKLLQHQQRQYQAAATAAQGEALAARIAGELAARGEAGAAREIYEIAEAERQREDTRVAALHALMQMNPAKARPILEKIIRGETEASLELRHNAVFILCRLDDGGTEVVLEALPRTKEPELLQAMVMCLAEDGSDRALDALVELLRTTDDPEVAQHVLMALGHRGDERSFAMLAEIARDPARDPEMRAHALIGLAQADDDRVVDIALEIVDGKDQPEQVMEMALMALAQSGSERASAALLTVAENEQASDDVRAMALFNAGVHGKLEVGRLREIYRTTHSRELKIQVCHVLSQMEGNDEAFEMVLEIVRTEQDPDIRNNVIFWLGQFDDPRAADALLEIINEK